MTKKTAERAWEKSNKAKTIAQEALDIAKLTNKKSGDQDLRIINAKKRVTALENISKDVSESTNETDKHNDGRFFKLEKEVGSVKAAIDNIARKGELSLNVHYRWFLKICLRSN